MKKCKKCGIEKCESDYPKEPTPRNPERRSRVCKRCISIKNKVYFAEYYRKNREKIGTERKELRKLAREERENNKPPVVARTEKACKRCGIIKPMAEFYYDIQSKEGRVATCRECARKAKREYRYKHRDQIRQKSREKYANNRDYFRNNAQKNKNKKKTAARNAVMMAVKKGALSRGLCEVCGATVKTEAHHDDYSKPLDVRWLCRSCHQRYHAKLRRDANKTTENFQEVVAF